MKYTTPKGIALVTLLLAAAASHANAQSTLQLTRTSGGGERQPTLSADARTVAYVAMLAGSRELFTIPTDGGQAKRWTTGAQIRVGWGTLDAWPSISISGDGRWLSYWNGQGVHSLDTKTSTDRTLDVTHQNPYPQLTEDGGTVFFQKPVNGIYEVFSVSSSGGTAVQLTSGSGFGYRHPSCYDAKTVLFQKPVAGAQEVFALDVATRVQRQLSQSSGYGNRYARVAPGGASAVFEATVQNCRQVRHVDLTTGRVTSVTQLQAMGDHMPVATADAEVFFQSRIQGLAMYRSESDGTKQIIVAQGLDGGLRRVSSDRHGHVLVYQRADTSGSLEVFRTRWCPSATQTAYGKAGTPSIGRLELDNGSYRCTLNYGLATSLGSNIGVFLLGAQSLNVAIPTAPGNSLYATPTILLPVVGQSGKFDIGVPVPGNTTGQIFTQWLVLDPAANTAGLVTSEGVRTDF